MDTINSAQFRKSYGHLKVTTHVTVNGHIIGTWIPFLWEELGDSVLADPKLQQAPAEVGMWFRRLFPNQTGKWHKVALSEWRGDLPYPRWWVRCECGVVLDTHDRRGRSTRRYEVQTEAPNTDLRCRANRTE